MNINSVNFLKYMSKSEKTKWLLLVARGTVQGALIVLKHFL